MSRYKVILPEDVKPLDLTETEYIEAMAIPIRPVNLNVLEWSKEAIQRLLADIFGGER